MFKAFSPLVKKISCLISVAFFLSALPSQAVITEGESDLEKNLKLGKGPQLSASSFDLEKSRKLAKGPEFSASVQVGIWRKDDSIEYVNATALRGRALLISGHALQEDDFQTEMGEDGIVTYQPFITHDKRSWGPSENYIKAIVYEKSVFYTKEGKVLSACTLSDDVIVQAKSKYPEEIIRIYGEMRESMRNVEAIYVSHIVYDWMPGLKGRHALIKLKEPVFPPTKIAKLNKELTTPIDVVFCSSGIDGNNTNPNIFPRANAQGKHLVHTNVQFDGNNLVHRYSVQPGGAPHQFLSKGDNQSKLNGIPWKNDSGIAVYFPHGNTYLLAGIYHGITLNQRLLWKGMRAFESKEDGEHSEKSSQSGKKSLLRDPTKKTDPNHEAAIKHLVQLGAGITSNIGLVDGYVDDPTVVTQHYMYIFDLLPWVTQCLEEKTMHKPLSKPAAVKVGVPSAAASVAAAAPSSALSDGIAKIAISKLQS